MTKLQLLHRALNERMMAAVEQIMELVGGTVLEYEEETTRMRKENEVLRRRLQSLDEANRSNWTGQCDSVTQFQQEQCAVSFEFGQESEAVVIKTENPDDPLYIRSVNSLATLPQSTDQGSPVAGTSASFTDSQKESMKCPSTQDYMEPVEFDPTSSIRFTNRGEREKRQRMSFACPDCGKKFGREQTLMFHLRTHSTEKPYEYRRRKKSFYGNGLTKKKLQGYSQIPSENTENVLDCSASVSRNSPPAEHLTGVQESDSLSTTSYGSSNENDPENTASNPEPQGKKGKNILKKKYDCSFCGDVFLTPEQLEFHKRSHLVDAGKALIPPSEEQDLKVFQGIKVSSRCFSKVWNYFSKDSSDHVICNLCLARISQGSRVAAKRNTSNMWTHLKGKHTSKYLVAKGFIKPINSRTNTMDMHAATLKHFELGESGIKQEFKEEPSFIDL